MNYSFEALKSSVETSANMLNGLILTSVGLLTTIFIFKILGKESFKVPVLDFELKLDKSWIVILVLTIGHLGSAIYLNKSVDRLLKSNNITTEQKKDVWSLLTIEGKGGILYREMEPRKEMQKPPLFGTIKIYNINNFDLAGILSLSFSILLFLALTDNKVESWKSFIFKLSIGLLLLIINWLIGSWWAINLSKLTY